MKITTALFCSAAGLLLAGSANSQVVVSTVFNSCPPNTSQYYHVDTGTGAGTALWTSWTGAANGDSGVGGLAADNTNGILYASGNPTACGGVKTVFSCAFGATNEPQILLTDPVDTAGNALDCSGMAFANGKLYVLTQYTAAPDGIYELDLTTGIGTAAYLFGGGFDMGGLGYNPTDGLFYGTNDYSASLGIWSFDIVTQTATFVAAYPAGVTDVDGCTVDPAGIVYLIEDNPAPLHAYDLNTAAYVTTLTNPITSSLSYSGGAWAPGLLESDPGVGYCFGDPGSGTPCPCINDNDGSVPGSGCANGVFASGAQLTGSGAASLSADTLVLSTSGLEPNNSGLYFQANNDLSPGNIWGDGLQCAGGQLKRLGVRFADASGNSDTSAWTTPISVKAGNVLAGDTKRYQCWYRTTVNPPCGLGVNDFNASNGFAVVWAP